MPKKRSIKPGFSKRLQRLYRRSAAGPSLPPEEELREAPARAEEAVAASRTPADLDRLRAAQAKRRSRAARNLLQT